MARKREETKRTRELGVEVTGYRLSSIIRRNKREPGYQYTREIVVRGGRVLKVRFHRFSLEN
jgi:hypothetical protein